MIHKHRGAYRLPGWVLFGRAAGKRHARFAYAIAAVMMAIL